MGVRYAILILSFLASFSMSAQEKISFAELDKGTFDLYQKSDWKGLKEMANRGLDSGFDYYYIRMRLGIAYYETNRFEKAVVHFKKALEFNQNDPVALEYLYYSLYFSGRKAESVLVASEMPEATRKKIGLPGENSITSAFFEGGMVTTRQPDSLVSFKPVGPYVYQYLLKDYMYLSGGISKNMGPRFSITASVNHMRFNALQEGTIKNPEIPFPQYFEWGHQNSQTGFYLGSEYLIKPGWTLGLAGHIIGGKFNYMRYNNQQGMGKELFTEWNIDYSDFVFFGRISRRVKTLEAGLAASLTDLGDITRFQPGIELNWYPLGNINFYLQANVDRIMPVEDLKDGDWVFQGLAGFKAFSKLWLEAHAALGRMTGWTEKSAYIVYNNQDPILRRMGANIIIPEIIPGLSLTFRYQLQQREHSWSIFNGDELEGTETKKYLSNSLIGGITWKF